jgi:hypothetical protein
MKISLRREEVAAIIAMADYYIENNREYNNKRAALLLRHKMKRYGKNITSTAKSSVVRDDRERCED